MILRFSFTSCEILNSINSVSNCKEQYNFLSYSFFIPTVMGGHQKTMRCPQVEKAENHSCSEMCIYCKE